MRKSSRKERLPVAGCSTAFWLQDFWISKSELNLSEEAHSCHELTPYNSQHYFWNDMPPGLEEMEPEAEGSEVHEEAEKCNRAIREGEVGDGR